MSRHAVVAHIVKPKKFIWTRISIWEQPTVSSSQKSEGQKELIIVNFVFTKVVVGLEDCWFGKVVVISMFVTAGKGLVKLYLYILMNEDECVNFFCMENKLH